jgi:hypothetical protein
VLEIYISANLLEWENLPISLTRYLIAARPELFLEVLAGHGRTWQSFGRLSVEHVDPDAGEIFARVVNKNKSKDDVIDLCTSPPKKLAAAPKKTVTRKKA